MLRSYGHGVHGYAGTEQKVHDREALNLLESVGHEHRDALVGRLPEHVRSSHKTKGVSLRLIIRRAARMRGRPQNPTKNDRGECPRVTHASPDRRCPC